MEPEQEYFLILRSGILEACAIFINFRGLEHLYLPFGKFTTGSSNALTSNILNQEKLSELK